MRRSETSPATPSPTPPLTAAAGRAITDGLGLALARTGSGASTAEQRKRGRKATMADPKEIYLEPKCCFNREIGRCWSEEDEWPLEEDEWPIDSGHEPATRYIRADLARPRVKRLEWEDAPRGSDGMEVAHAPGGS